MIPWDSKNVIKLRAERLARLTTHLLIDEGRDDPETVSAYRYAFLVLRRPAQFARQFGSGDMRIVESEVDQFLWDHDASVPGPRGLMAEERVIIGRHNQEATKWMRERGILRSTCTDIAPLSSTPPTIVPVRTM